MAGYLERGSHIGEVCDAASDNEDLACVWRRRFIRKADLNVVPEIQLRVFSPL